ncbi:hypothetical protein [Flavobacterium sp. HNIBRBA15423]|uniref:hypothetical protein n=1 Tax=Flavobacterium sp. HNIBRBA15423 TaxID=3458683 RepID=UPI004044D9D7
MKLKNNQRIMSNAGYATVFLEDIAIADRKLRTAIKNNPEFEDQLNGCFLKLKRTDCLTDILYPSHVDELINRIIENDPLEKLTEAEILSLMSKVNQFISLPGNEFTTAIKQLFSKLIEDELGIVDDISNGLEERTGSKWDDESKELILKIKNKFSIKFRSSQL